MIGVRSFLEWLLSLDRLDLHGAPLTARRISLQWLEPFEAWVWFILILVVPTYVILIYRHESGTVRSRVLMAGARALLILFTLMLLCTPALVDRRRQAGAGPKRPRPNPIAQSWKGRTPS